MTNNSLYRSNIFKRDNCMQVAIMLARNLTSLVSTTVLPAKTDSDVMFCLQRYKGRIVDTPLVY